LDDPAAMEGKAAATEETPLLEQRVLSDERHVCFGNFVEKLPASYRAVYVLCELEELTNQETAEILGLSLEVVKIRLHRGRARLLQELRMHCKAEDWL
jgi:RNA polymerase sigma-70 factor (ECF subfamily)